VKCAIHVVFGVEVARDISAAVLGIIKGHRPLGLDPEQIEQVVEFGHRAIVTTDKKPR